MEYKILSDNISHSDLKNLSFEERELLCSELRDKILNTVSTNGGHLASNLGAVELTVSLLSVFDYKKDKLLFDVGHQAYSYKLLTGRFSKFDTLRQKGGISGFQRISESEYDAFDTGHSSTSISAGLGMARARDLSGGDNYVVSIIGDGALTGGLAYEALNDLGHSKTKMIVILNDNEMSIARNVGGMSKYLKKLRSSQGYISAKHSTENFLVKHLPVIGKPVVSLIMRIKRFFRFLVNKQTPSMFEDLGLVYYGPVDGHDTKALISTLNAIKDINAPVLLHVCTQKGKGYEYSETRPSDYHGVGPFNLKEGIISSGKASFTSTFGDKLVDIASVNKNVVAITAAMSQGTGLDKFAKNYPDRFFDVGIAEEHAVTMAGGLSRCGFVPVVAVYSSFLQRAYDQMIHDVAFMNNHVVFAIDRAGFVGNDGHTHNGLLDISYVNSMQGVKMLSPANYKELELSLEYAINCQNGPCAIRYPRGASSLEEVTLSETVDDLKKPLVLKNYGDDYVLLTTGSICGSLTSVADTLNGMGIKGKHVNVAMINPLPANELLKAFNGCKKVFVVEEAILSGGFGEMLRNKLSLIDSNVLVSPIAVEDVMIRAGSVDQQRMEAKIDAESVVERISSSLK